MAELKEKGSSEIKVHIFGPFGPRPSKDLCVCVLRNRLLGKNSE